MDIKEDDILKGVLTFIVGIVTANAGKILDWIRGHRKEKTDITKMTVEMMMSVAEREKSFSDKTQEYNDKVVKQNHDLQDEKIKLLEERTKLVDELYKKDQQLQNCEQRLQIEARKNMQDDNSPRRQRPDR